MEEYETEEFQKVMLSELTERIEELNSGLLTLEKDPKKIINKQINDQSIQKVSIGRIDIEYMSGKRS